MKIQQLIDEINGYSEALAIEDHIKLHTKHGVFMIVDRDDALVISAYDGQLDLCPVSGCAIKLSERQIS